MKNAYIPNRLDEINEKISYPEPTGFPDIRKTASPVPVMEDYLLMHYLGEPDYNRSAGKLAYTASYWDNDLPYARQDFVEHVYAVQAAPASLAAFADAAEAAVAAGNAASPGTGIPQGFLHPERITAGGRKENRPHVLSDGSVLFLSDAGNAPLPERGEWEQRTVNEFFLAPQIYRSQDGKAEKLTAMRHGIKDYLVSPDEAMVLFSSYRYDEDALADLVKEQDDAARKAQLEKRAVTPISYDSLPFKSDAELGYSSKRSLTWWVYTLADGSLSCLFEEGKPFAAAANWSPDGKSLVWQKSEEGKLLFLRKPVGEAREEEGIPKTDSASVPFASVTVPSAGYESFLPCFSPDGKWLYFAAGMAKNAPYAAPARLACIPAAGGEDLTPIYLATEENTPDGICPDEYNFASRSADGTEVLPLSDGSCLFTGGFRGSVSLFASAVPDAAALPDAAAKGAPIRLTKDYQNLHSLCTVDERHLLCLYSTPLLLPVIALISFDPQAPEKTRILPLVDVNPWLQEKKLIHPQELRVMSLDHEEELQGWVIVPDALTREGSSSSGEKIPAILYVHGGPSGFYSTALNYEFQSLAAAGFALIFGNPRGGSGYGLEHSRDEKAYGDMAMNDLIQLADEACRRFPQIDPKRIGITGGSYGGYATIWGASHSRRYKAASAIRPLANMQMIAASTMHAGGAPGAQARESYLDVMLDAIHESPTSYADKIACPFQILQAELDMNCIVDQAHQLYVGIKDLHPELPCRLVLYPDGGHGLLHLGPVYLAVMQRIDNQRWFEAYL